MSVIYLLSSLPTILPDGAPPLRADAFLDACRRELSAADAAACAALLEGGACEHPFVAAWRDKETMIRNAAAKARAAAAGVDAARWVRATVACDVMVERLAESALREKNPLERERLLDQARWAAVEELEGCDPLGKSRVFAYAVKLAIAQRRAAPDAAQGSRNFETLTSVPITL